MKRNETMKNIVLRTTLFLFLLQLYCLATAAQQTTVKVWPNGAPGAINSAAYREDTVYTETGRPRIRRVIAPELTAYLLPKGNAPRAAVIICPGGSYGRLAIDLEGYDVAAWFNQIGVVGIVLTYRLPSDTIMTDKSIGPLQDAQEAVRIVRRNAEAWNIDPHKIGIMGFSAGGHLAASASTLFLRNTYTSADSTSARPDFSLLIYPVISMQDSMTHSASRKNLLGEHPDPALIDLFSIERQVATDTPPAFLVHSANDNAVPLAGSMAYFAALKKYSVPVEIHIYETGGHGYGLAKTGATESGWPEACRIWMEAHKLIH
jgi:acetyl esterase/lipase